jgi:hypothetical protein
MPGGAKKFKEETRPAGGADNGSGKRPFFRTFGRVGDWTGNAGGKPGFAAMDHTELACGHGVYPRIDSAWQPSPPDVPAGLAWPLALALMLSGASADTERCDRLSTACAARLRLPKGRRGTDDLKHGTAESLRQEPQSSGPDMPKLSQYQDSELGSVHEHHAPHQSDMSVWLSF